jgi:hypothetical protein
MADTRTAETPTLDGPTPDVLPVTDDIALQNKMAQLASAPPEAAAPADETTPFDMSQKAAANPYQLQGQQAGAPPALPAKAEDSPLGAPTYPAFPTSTAPAIPPIATTPDQEQAAYLANKGAHPMQNDTQAPAPTPAPQAPQAGSASFDMGAILAAGNKPQPAASSSWWDNFTGVHGSNLYGAAAGALGGVAKVASGVDAAMYAAGRANPVSQAIGNALGLSNQPYQSPENMYEKAIGQPVTSSQPYQIAKAAGEMGTYMATPGMEGAGLTPIVARMAEGLGVGGFDSAGRQMQAKGKIDASQLVGDSLISGGLGIAGGVAAKYGGKAVKNIIGRLPKKGEGELPPSLAPSVEGAGGDSKMLQGSVSKEEKPGIFRRTIGSAFKGFNSIEGAKSIADIAPALTAKLEDELREAHTKVMNALSKMKHAKNVLEATATNALRLANTEEEKARILIKEELIATSAAAERIAKHRTEMYEAGIAEEKERLAKRIEELKAALGKAVLSTQRTFKQELAILEEAQRKLQFPHELFGLEKGKHLHGVLDETLLQDEAEMSKTLAKDYDGAIDQAEEATKTYKATINQYDALRHYYKSVYEEAEEAVQKFFGHEERLNLKGTVREGNKTAEGSMGVNFKGATLPLMEAFKIKHDAFLKALQAEEGAYHKDIILATKAKLGKGKTIEQLQKGRNLIPPVDKLIMAASLGPSALDMPAQAASGEDDEETPEHKIVNFGNLCIAAGVSYMFVRNGPRYLKQMLHDRNWFYKILYANTLDFAKFADHALQGAAYKAGIAFDNKMMSLNYRILSTEADMLKAQMFSPDKPEKMVAVLFGHADINTLSTHGQVLGQVALDSIKELKKFVVAYSKAFDDWYKELPEKQKASWDSTRQVVHWVKNGLTTHEELAPMDRMLFGLFANAAKGYFTFSTKNSIAQLVDFPTFAPLQVGWKQAFKGTLLYARSAYFRKLAGHVHLGGVRSQAIEEATKNTPNLLFVEHQTATAMEITSLSHFKAMVDESVKANPNMKIFNQASTGPMTLASLIDFNHKNPRMMQSIANMHDIQFVEHFLTGKLSEDVEHAAFMKMVQDVGETFGYDQLRLIKDPLSRSKYAGKYLQFYGQLARYARDMVFAISVGNIGGVIASQFMLQQIGGAAVLPAMFRQILWINNPALASQATNFFNAYSLGQNLFGDLMSKTDYDLLFWPFMTSQAPGLENAFTLIGNLGNTYTEMQTAFGGIIANPHSLIDDPDDKNARKIQKALKRTLDDISLFKPALAGVPLQAFSAFMVNLPGFLNDDFAASIPSPGMGGSRYPLVPEKVYHFPGARMESGRAMVRAPHSAQWSQFEKAIQGLQYRKPNLTDDQVDALNKAAIASGVREQ